jgi:hypothetical protein
MGRFKPLKLATFRFEKQGTATDFFKAILIRYRPGE